MDVVDSPEWRVARDFAEVIVDLLVPGANDHDTLMANVRDLLHGAMISNARRVSLARSAALAEAAAKCEEIADRVRDEFPNSACCNCYMSAEEARYAILALAEKPHA